MPEKRAGASTRAATWLITGTGTDVGKTVVMAALLRALHKLGVECQAVKAIQTGCGDDGLSPDVEMYKSACSPSITHAPFTFTQPCSPHRAARLDGRQLLGSAVCREIRRLAEKSGVTLVEGAGGLLVPIDSRTTFAEVARELNARLILVVNNRLGAINQALLTMEAAINRGLGIEAVVFSTTRMDGTHSILEEVIRQDNIETIRQKAGTAIVVDLGHIPQLSPADSAVKREDAWNHTANLLAPVADLIAKQVDPVASRKFDADLRYDALHIWHPYSSTHPAPPVWHVAATKGNRIVLSDGRELIDGMSSWWSAIHGYNHPRLLTALRAQAGRMPHVMFGGLTHKPAVELAKKLVGITPAGLERVFFADSGSVAVEAAMKMALQYHQARGDVTRTRFVAPRGGYHGDTQGAMSVCDPVTGMHTLFSGTLARQIFVQRPSCRFGEEYSVESARQVEETFRAHPNEIAAFIAEPIVQGTGGMWFYHPDYLKDVRAICDKFGALLILDEIATGFGKTGKLFASEWAGVVPDILCLGKALTGGVTTLAAVMAQDRIAETIAQKGVFMHGPTFMANPLACAIACASIDLLMEADWTTEVGRLETALSRGLESCRELPGVADVRVLGAIGAVEMEQPVNGAVLQSYFVDQGVWIRPFAKLIYLMPPYITSDKDVATLTTAVEMGVKCLSQ